MALSTPRPLGALRAIVAVHPVVAAADCPNAPNPDPLDLLLQLLEIAHAAARRSVSPVQDRVHDNLVRCQTLLASHPQQCEEVLDVTVHPSVQEQPHEMQALPRSPDLAHDLQQHRVAEKAAVANGQRDAHEVLVRDASRAEVLVANFAIAHLSSR